MMDKKVSVVISANGQEANLGGCLKSILNQTVKDIEIVVAGQNKPADLQKILTENGIKEGLVSWIRDSELMKNISGEKMECRYLFLGSAACVYENAMLEKAIEKLEQDKAELAILNADAAGSAAEKDKMPLERQMPPYAPFGVFQITGNIWKLSEEANGKLCTMEYAKKICKEFAQGGKRHFENLAIATASRITFISEKYILRQGNDIFCEENPETLYKELKTLREMLRKEGLFDAFERDYVNYALHVLLQNMDRLSKERFEGMYDKVKKDWLQELGILGHEPEYFTSADDYLELTDIMKYDAQEYATKISVVIPVHNAEKYIEKCLDSVLEKQNIGLEVICVDDCSTDHSLQILEAYQKKYPNLKVLRNEKNLFAGTSRNRGLLEAKGQYMHFLDADDSVVENAFEELYILAHRNNLDWLKTTVEGVDEATGEVVENRQYAMKGMDRMLDEKLLDFEHFPKKFFTLSVVPWNGIYKRSFLLENNIRFNHLFCVNDRSFFTTICIKGKRMMVTRRLLVRHLVNIKDSLVGKRAQHFDCQFESYRITKQICDDNHVSENVRFEILEHDMYDLFVWYRKFHEQGSLTEEMEEQMKKFIQEQDIAYFEKYKEKSRWLKFRDMVQV